MLWTRTNSYYHSHVLPTNPVLYFCPSPVADSKMVSLVAGRENLEGRLEGEAVSATDSHILLRRDGKAEPGFECLHDGDIQPQPFAVRNDKESSDLHIHCCHNDLYYSRGIVLSHQ